MREGWQVGRIGSVPLYLKPGGILFVLVSAWLLAALFFPVHFPDLSPPLRWLLALGTSLLVTFSVLAHEAGHVEAGQRRGMAVNGVALFYFGAVAWFDDEPARPTDEGVVAMAGPAVNGVLALLFLALWAALPVSWVVGADIVRLLAEINVALMLFNALPAYPLDGGRLLHALLWQGLRDGAKATRATARVGQGLGLFCLLAGLISAVATQHLLPFLMGAILAAFLFQGAVGPLRFAGTRWRMREVQVGELVWRESPTLRPSQSLHEASILMARHVERELPVVEAEWFVGLLTHTDLGQVAHADRAQVQVGHIMRVAARVPFLTVDERADAALRRMVRANLVSLPVLEGGRWVGLLRQRDLVQASRTDAGKGG